MITVYHGSNMEIPKPSLDYGRADTDFGSGFYVTDDYAMAEKWACRKGVSVINKYQLDISELNGFEFDLDENWLNFVVSNRNSETPAFDTKGYDYLCGATADDKLFSTIEMYENGIISQDTAIEALNCMKVGKQICIKTQKGLENLHYIGKDEPNDSRKNEIQLENRKERKIANQRTQEIIKKNNNKNNASPQRFDSGIKLADNIETDKIEETNSYNK